MMETQFADRKDRIQYLDAMRGITMVLVVFSHVLLGFSGHPSFSFNSVFVTFRMPLFFFLSGFLMFKTGRFNRFSDSAAFLWKKFKIQIIPTVLFGGLFCFLFSHTLLEFIYDPAKLGYWFTYMLFFYFLIYVVLSHVLSKLFSETVSLWMIFAVSFFIALHAYFCTTNFCPYKNWPGLKILSHINFRYFVYFVFGAITRKEFEGFQRKMDAGWFMAFIVFAEIVLLLFKQFNPFSGHAGLLVEILINLVLGFLGIIIVFAFFRKYQASFSKGTRAGRALQYIGVRTLDIYLIHYFVIPRNLSFIGRFFEQYNNPVIELSVGLLLAAIVIALCLLISSLIRTSDFWAKMLFGKVLPANN